MMNHKATFDFTEHAYLMNPGRRIYFVGIAGISMSGLAELAQARGQVVAGSDLHQNDRVLSLQEIGISVQVGPQRASDIQNFRPDAVVYSAAIPADNPQLAWAKAAGIPQIERADWLGLVNREFPHVINIAGTNGKSTTTAMCSYLCLDSGLNPTVHLGAELDRFHSTIHAGSDRLMISEACEFNYSFYSFYSTITAILNLDHDHVDMFPQFEDVIRAFAHYLCLQRAGTKVVLPGFDPAINRLWELAQEEKPDIRQDLDVYYFGYETDRPAGGQPDLIIQDLDLSSGFPHFCLCYRGRDLGDFQLQIPGKFNAENAAAAVLLAILAGADSQTFPASLGKFKGAEGRFTVCGKYQGAWVINDYAHHPDSVKKTIEAAERIPHKHLYACFQPITYSRAKGLAQGYIEAMQNLTPAIFLEVYDDREKDHSFSSRELAEGVIARGGSALFFAQKKDLEQYLRSRAEAQDLILLMGQDIRDIGDALCSRKDHYEHHVGLNDVAD